MAMDQGQAVIGVNCGPSQWVNALAAGNGFATCSNTVTKTINANQQGSTTTGGSFNTAANTFVIANGAHADIVQNCSGLIIANDNTATGDSGIYVMGGNAVVLVATSLGDWVASTTTPGAGKFSIALDGGTFYAIYNNEGAQLTFSVTTICTRNSN